MNIGEVSDWLGLSRSTVRKYLSDFGNVENAFSLSALPGPSKHRRFTDQDVAVLAWISQQYSEYHQTTDEVRAALIRRIMDGEDFEPPPHPDQAATLALVPREQYDEVLSAHKRALEIAVAERDALMTILDKEREKNLQEVARLNQKIGRLIEKVMQLGGNPNVD